jgi:hypothetical protein
MSSVLGRPFKGSVEKIRQASFSHRRVAAAPPRRHRRRRRWVGAEVSTLASRPRSLFLCNSDGCGGGGWLQKCAGERGNAPFKAEGSGTLSSGPLPRIPRSQRVPRRY